jgi:ASC-1-like (ASCH) protein
MKSKKNKAAQTLVNIRWGKATQEDRENQRDKMLAGLKKAVAKRKKAKLKIKPVSRYESIRKMKKTYPLDNTRE